MIASYEFFVQHSFWKCIPGFYLNLIFLFLLWILSGTILKVIVLILAYQFFQISEFASSLPKWITFLAVDSNNIFHFNPTCSFSPCLWGNLVKIKILEIEGLTVKKDIHSNALNRGQQVSLYFWRKKAWIANIDQDWKSLADPFGRENHLKY